MKLWTSLAALVGLATLVVSGLTAQAGTIVGSRHDMTTVFGAGTIKNDEICLPCHTPHNVLVDPLSATGAKLGKLWNHAMSSQVYTLYDGKTLSNSTATITATTKYMYPLDETSRKCLSCHDGTVAVDSYGQAGGVTVGTHKIGTANEQTVTDPVTGAVTGGASTAGYLVGAGGDLTHDHPVSVRMLPSTSTNGPWTSKHDPTTITTLRFGTDPSGVKNIVTCGTCHTPHDPTNGSFLAISNARSALCLSCHIK